VNLKGKGFYIWKIPSCEGGDPQAIAQSAHQAGLTHVFIKIANGIYDYNYDPATRADLIEPVANALHAKNIAVWGWHYVFGDLPKDEAKAAIRQVNRLPLDGYIIDAEGEYKGKYTPCRIFMQELRNALPDFPIALSSYRYPKYHMDFPWTDFLNYCDLNMPQVYWEQLHNPADQLDRSILEFQTLITPIRPIIPTGAAYCAGGWCATQADVLAFLDRSVSRGLDAANFWSWDYCRVKLPQIWETIANYEWPSAPNPEKSLAEKYIAFLNIPDIDQILGLYTDDAVHINASRTIQGKLSIRNHYQEYFSTIPSNSSFSLLSDSGNDETRHISWDIKNGGIKIAHGTETIGVSNQKIIYHYSSIE
jgi:hypothetical protein